MNGPTASLRRWGVLPDRYADKQVAASTIDARGRIIAASDGQGIFSESVRLDANGAAQGYYQDSAGATVAFHATPGYETYRGLGWYGVIVQNAR